jgi:hypothetical protein
MRDIAESLRRIVRRAVPDAIERVRPGWRLIGYDLPRDHRRSTYFCFIVPEPEHVHLGFEYGTLMADDDRLLLGEGITKKVRWVTLREPPVIPAPHLERLVQEGARVALMSRDERVLRALEMSGEAPVGM